MVTVTDPETCTIFDRSQVELEEFLCFCIAVAGKTARVVQRCMKDFWTGMVADAHYTVKMEPFDLLRWYRLEQITERLKEAGIGCQTMKARAMRTAALSFELADLTTVTLEDLESIPGIGRKTSRFFLLHSREDANCACLDVHVLRWLQEQGVKTTGQTPGSAKEYRRLEQEFLSRVPEGKTVAEFDLEIWTEKSRKVNV